MIDWGKIDNEVLEVVNNNPEIRLGQAYFWCTWYYHRIICDKIIDTEFDCYFDDEKIIKFRDKVNEFYGEENMSVLQP